MDYHFAESGESPKRRNLSPALSLRVASHENDAGHMVSFHHYKEVLSTV